jgi:hypothetical protein
MKNKPLPSPQPAPPATRAQVDAFLKGLQRFRAKGDQPLDEAGVKRYDEAGVKTYLDKMSVVSQQGIARRIMMDILKSPTRDLPGGKSESPRRPPKKRPKKKASSKAGSKRASKKKRAPVKKKKASRRR